MQRLTAARGAMRDTFPPALGGTQWHWLTRLLCSPHTDGQQGSGSHRARGRGRGRSRPVLTGKESLVHPYNLLPQVLGHSPQHRGREYRHP